jgi:hypothetical protein
MPGQDLSGARATIDGWEPTRADVPLHMTRQGHPPVHIRVWWFHASFPGRPYREDPSDSVPVHSGGGEGVGGVMETSCSGLRYKG